MYNNSISLPRLLTFTFFIFSIFLIPAAAQSYQPFSPFPVRPNSYANPFLKSPAAGCAAANLRAERFASEVTADERVKLCQSIERVTNKLNSTVWSPALSAELQNIWQVFSAEAVTLRLMPQGTPSQILAMAEPFPAGSTGSRFSAAVAVRSEKSDAASFFQILLHELRHVLDFHDTWKNKTALDSLEIERRAFLLMGKLTQETPEKENFSGVPKFWKESWRKRPEAEIAAMRQKAIEKYLFGKKMYRELTNDPKRRTLDYSYLQKTVKSDARQTVGGYDSKKGEQLPQHKSLPKTNALIPQNVRETDFNLEKPKNPRDPKEIWRVALNNEKKLYYGMSNFVYDQNVNFQCLNKGKISASFNENNTVARGNNGDAMFRLASSPAALPCVVNYQNLQTDFTDTFWASPALDKMPMYFSGFFEVDGVTLAHYTVLPPDERLFNELANQYPEIRPFRVPVGTIYVSPEDGQIVRFAGTSFPEQTVTGSYSQKVRATYWVKAVRQKLNINGGLWVTVHIGTVAVANVQGKHLPFNYTVKFENYRQSMTDIKIIDDDVVAENITR